MTGSDGGADADGEERDDEAPTHSPPDPLLLDLMLGTLATYLRMCGYDAAYAGDRGIEADDRLFDLSRTENRTLLTRDRDLAARTDGAVLLTARDVEAQLGELAAAGFELSLPGDPSRCGTCNGVLDPLSAEDPRPAYAPDDEPAWRCRDCGQVFWRGSHWDDVAARLERARSAVGDGEER